MSDGRPSSQGVCPSLPGGTVLPFQLPSRKKLSLTSPEKLGERVKPCQLSILCLISGWTITHLSNQRENPLFHKSPIIRPFPLQASAFLFPPHFIVIQSAWKDWNSFFFSLKSNYNLFYAQCYFRCTGGPYSMTINIIKTAN